MDFLDWDAHRLSSALKVGEISPVEVMAATLARIDTLNPSLNAIVSLRDRDLLYQRALAAQDQKRKGWLHGVPIAIKDLADAEGLPTSKGSSTSSKQLANADDPMVARLRAAGAIIVGKTNTPEFGLGSHTYNPVFGATRNAIDPTRSAGGSSGGAAVGLASRMLCVADGSDMMGSLRNPAGWNEVYGMRPTFGLVPSAHDQDCFLHQLSTNGPMARCPKDLAMLLETMSGGTPPSQSPNWLDADLSGRRIGWLGDWGGAYAMDSGLRYHCEEQVQRLRDVGCVVEEVDPPTSASALWSAWTTLRSWSISRSLGEVHQSDPDRLKPEALWEIENARELDLAKIEAASATRAEWNRKAGKLFEEFDTLVLPTAQCWPFPLHWDWPKEIAGHRMDTYHRWMEIVIPASLIGLPVVAVPAGRGVAGLPIGLQFIGRRGDDLGQLQMAQAWHSLTQPV